MATVQEKISELNGVKTAIRQALIDKGVNMDDVPFTGFADKIGEISNGGGKFPEGYKLVVGLKSVFEIESSSALFPLCIKVSGAECNGPYASPINHYVKFGSVTLMSGTSQGGGSNEFRNGFGFLSILDAVSWDFDQILNKANKILGSSTSPEGSTSWYATITVVSWLEKVA